MFTDDQIEFRNKKKVLTLEELYVEILYTLLHMFGCDSNEVTWANLDILN